MRFHRKAVDHRGRTERGAVLVEMSIVAVFLLTLIAGAYDYGQAWRSSLVVNEAARTGARVGSAQGPNRGADFYALSGLKSALASGGGLEDLQRVVVFRATASGKVPEACKTGSTSACQVITGTAFRTNWETQPVNSATTTTGCLVIASSKNWCPTGRDNRQEFAEYYGVWVKTRHDHDFTVFGSGTDVTRTATMRLEPKVT